MMEINPAEFQNVPLNTRQPAACSPTPPGANWKGLLIRAPHRVKFPLGPASASDPPATHVVPLCGYYLVEVDPTRAGEKMRINMVDRRSGQTYSGTIHETDPSPEEPPPDDAPKADPKLLSGMASGGYFNVNLLDFVSLPAATATYDVHLELRNYRSNREMITIEYASGP